MRRPLSPLGHLLSAGVLTFLAGISIQYVLLFGGDRALYLDIPRGYSSAALVAGGVASAVAFLVVLVREHRELRRGPGAMSRRRRGSPVSGRGHPPVRARGGTLPATGSRAPSRHGRAEERPGRRAGAPAP